MASKDFSNKLKNLRLKAGYSQKDVYEHFKIPQSTFSSWEVGKSEPSGEMLIKLCEFYKCDMIKEFSTDEDLTYEEWNMLEKYRSLDAFGQETVSYILDREVSRMEQFQKRESPVIGFEEHHSTTLKRLISYYYKNASAGTGQLIIDNLPEEDIEIPDIPKYKNVSYAIGVNGSSMEPTYHDGDILLVEATREIQIGEIGIFQINDECFVKKFGEKELISLNPESGNIPLNESARIMGRVIDKLK